MRALPALLATAALTVGPVLHPSPAPAAGTFIGPRLATETFLLDGGTTPCTGAVTSSSPTNVAVAENGAAVTASTSTSGTVTSDTDASDVVTVATQLDVAASVTSVGGNPSSVTFIATGGLSASTTKATSRCKPMSGGEVELAYPFTVSQGGFLTITTTTGPHGAVTASISKVNERGSVHIGGDGAKSEGRVAVYLAPGSYESSFLASATVFSDVAVPPTALSASLRGEFTVAGSQLVASQGKGQKFVTFPSARSCDGHALLPRITDKSRQVRQVKRVTFFVNGSPVLKVRTPGRGAQVTLPVADGERADVRAEATLVSKRKGRPAKVLTTTASYEACS